MMNQKKKHTIQQLQHLKNKHISRVLFVSFILLLFIIILNMNLGVIKMTPLEVIKTLVGQGTVQQNLVLFEFRLPRIILAILIGAGLSVSGAILQGITKNPLADSGILGINAGAGLFVAFFIMHFNKISIINLPTFSLPIIAFSGGVFAAFIIYVLSLNNGKAHPVRIILVGIGINMLLNSLLLLLQLKMDPLQYISVEVWLAGSIWGSNWQHVLSLLPWVCILTPYIFSKSTTLNIMNMGDDTAIGLGIPLERERLMLSISAVALASSCVSVSGGISFVGLIAPHLSRRIVGPKYEYLIPMSAFMGALLVLLSDTFARQLLSPREIPTGIVVAVIGVPYFLYLLTKLKS